MMTIEGWRKTLLLELIFLYLNQVFFVKDTCVDGGKVARNGRKTAI